MTYATVKCSFFSLFFSLLQLIVVSEAIIFEKNCITFEESFDFNEDRFSGLWYEIRRLYDPTDTKPQEECVQQLFSRAKNMMEMEILRSAQTGNNSSEPVYSSGLMEPQVFENSNVPQFFLRYNTTSPADPDTRMHIVKTDYSNYAILYSCNQLDIASVGEEAWVLTRKKAVPKPAADIINNFILKHFTHKEHTWRVINHSSKLCKPTLLEAMHSAANIPITRANIWLCLSVLLFMYTLHKSSL